ncbi:hypothetical protein Peur_053321 [Populus x canadensis]
MHVSEEFIRASGKHIVLLNLGETKQENSSITSIPRECIIHDFGNSYCLTKLQFALYFLLVNYRVVWFKFESLSTYKRPLNLF